MAFDGSGNYVLPATTVTPAVADTTIDPTEFNTFTADLATALSLCLTEDGQNVPTANLPMATNRHTGVGDAVALTDYASANQVVDNTLHYGGASAVGTDAYAVNLPISPGAYVAGNRYQFIADVANTGTCSINFSSIGVKSIKMQDGNDPVDNYILANSIVDVEYDGTNMVLMGLPSVGVNTASPQILTNKELTTPTVTNPAITGTVTGSALYSSPEIDQIVDSEGNEAVIFAEVVSAVNEVTVANAASGNKPSINQTGTDDLGLDIEGVELHDGAVTSLQKIIDNAAGTERRIFYQTAGVNRWELSADSSAEGGANSGSNFTLRRYNDAGTLIDSPFIVNRASGLFTVSNLNPNSAGTAIAGQATGDLGTEAWLVKRTVNLAIVAGADYAGSDLAYYGAYADLAGTGDYRGNAVGAALSGTWRARGSQSAIAASNSIALFTKVAN